MYLDFNIMLFYLEVTREFKHMLNENIVYKYKCNFL